MGLPKTVCKTASMCGPLCRCMSLVRAWVQGAEGLGRRGLFLPGSRASITTTMGVDSGCAPFSVHWQMCLPLHRFFLLVFPEVLSCRIALEEGWQLQEQGVIT